jgi:hypothetical protein
MVRVGARGDNFSIAFAEGVATPQPSTTPYTQVHEHPFQEASEAGWPRRLDTAPEHAPESPFSKGFEDVFRLRTTRNGNT